MYISHLLEQTRISDRNRIIIRDAWNSCSPCTLPDSDTSPLALRSYARWKVLDQGFGDLKIGKGVGLDQRVQYKVIGTGI
jgi:hypothetical protein